MATAQPANASSNPSLPFPLQDGETVVSIARRHWIYLWPLVALRLVAALVPVAFLAWALDTAGILDGVVRNIFLVAALLYIGYWAVRIALTWYNFYNDIWVITNQRLIDCHRPHPFDMSISTADLINVQDMTIERSGILRTVLDFGNIVCQTASIDQDFMITGVPNPRGLQALVDRERDRERNRLRNL
jgi:hypothetical protein